MADMVRIKTSISVNYIAGSTREDFVEISREEWEEMPPEEQEAFLDEIAQQTLANSVEASAWVEEDEG